MILTDETGVSLDTPTLKWTVQPPIKGSGSTITPVRSASDAGIPTTIGGPCVTDPDAVHEAVDDGVGVTVGVGTPVDVLVGVLVEVLVSVGDEVLVGVGVLVTVNVVVDDGLAVMVSVGVNVDVALGELVGLEPTIVDVGVTCVFVGDGVTVAVDCGVGDGQYVRCSGNMSYLFPVRCGVFNGSSAYVPSACLSHTGLLMSWHVAHISDFRVNVSCNHECGWNCPS